MKIARQTCARGRIHVLLAAIAFILILAALTIAVPALAQPANNTGLSARQAEIQRLKSEIASINLASEQAVERYNQANIELENTRQQMAQNEKTLAETSIKLDAARIALEDRLLRIYRDGSLGILDVILYSKSFNDFINRFEMLGRISQQDQADVEEFLKYKAEIEQTQAALETTRQQQEKALSSLAEEKSLVESGLAARKQLLASAEAEVAQALTRQMRQGQIATPRSQETAETRTEPPAPESGTTDSDNSTAEDPQPEVEPAPDPQPEPEPAPDPPSEPGSGDQPPPPANGNAVSIAVQYLGVPYVWGGADPSGFDCSGLTMYVYAQMGISLPHSAEAQYYAGTPVSPSEMEPGDLVFFGNPISHVGIYVGGGSMIHAPLEGSVVSYSGIGGNVGAVRL